MSSRNLKEGPSCRFFGITLIVPSLNVARLLRSAKGLELRVTEHEPAPRVRVRPHANAKAVAVKFTPLQGQYLAFIDAYSTLNGVAPAERDLERYFRVTPPTIHQMILTLARDGHISRVPGHARSIRLVVPREELPRLEPVSK